MPQGLASRLDTWPALNLLRLYSLTTIIFATLSSSFFASSAWAISSTFDDGNEGWSVESRNLQDNFTLEGSSSVPYQPAGGNPGGHLSITDPTNFSDFFAASASYLGNKTDFIEGTLSFEVKSDSDGIFEDVQSDVLLVGGGLILAYDSTFLPPTASFQPLTVPLEPAAEWRVVGGGLATPTDFNTVMLTLDALLIRGDWIDGTDTARLDNVNMVAEPSTALLLGLGIVGLARMRRSLSRRM